MSWRVYPSNLQVQIHKFSHSKVLLYLHFRLLLALSARQHWTQEFRDNNVFGKIVNLVFFWCGSNIIEVFLYNTTRPSFLRPNLTLPKCNSAERREYKLLTKSLTFTSSAWRHLIISSFWSRSAAPLPPFSQFCRDSSFSILWKKDIYHCQV